MKHPSGRLERIPRILVVSLIGLTALTSICSATSENGSRAPSEVLLPEAAFSEAGRGWWTEALETIQAMEYEASLTARGLQAPNRAHDLRTVFHETGIEIVPRRESEPSWRSLWSTTQYGRENALEPVPATPPAHLGSRVEYRHGALIERYDNGESGLGQTFVVEEPPSGEGPLVIDGQLGGDLTARVDPAGLEVELQNGQGVPVLRHGGLTAEDAAGRTLPVSVAIEGSRLRLLVDDQGADYPIRIEKAVENSGWYVDGGAWAAQLGIGLSTAGDVNGDGFSDIVIGANGFYPEEMGRVGRVWVYYGPSLDQYWFVDGDQVLVEFGYTCSTAGDVNGDGFDDVIVSAYEYENDDGTIGRVSVYHGGAGGMTEPAAWEVASPLDTSSYFGRTVSSAGDVNGDGYDDIIFGAPNYPGDDGAEGRAFVYLGSSDGLEEEPIWFAEGNQDGCAYGWSVATAGDVNADGYADVLVGAPVFDGTAPAAGRAFLYLGGPTGPSVTPDWVKDGDAEGDEYGFIVDAAGDTNGDGYSDVIIGAPYATGAVQSEGRAYLYNGTSSGLEIVPSWWDQGETADEKFGLHVATAGDVNGDGLSDVLVGALDFSDDQDQEGRACLYYGSRAGLEPEPRWIEHGDQTHCDYGARVATAGDVDGDGFSDFLVAATAYENTLPIEGRVWLYVGSGDAPRESAGWVVEPNQAQAHAGASVANAGDINGDGYEDLLVGAPDFDFGQADEGVVFLFLGHGYGPNVVADWYAESNQAGSEFGGAVSGAGDVNGDGYDDILVGAPLYDGTNTDAGRVFLWLGTPSGGPTGNPANADWTLGDFQPEMYWGQSVAGAGDVNGDGFGDIVIGAPGTQHSDVREGSARVYLGGDSGLNTSSAWAQEGNQPYAYFGWSVASAGDVNGDGYSDLMVGAPWYDSGDLNEGVVYLYNGSPDGPSPGPSWSAESNQVDAHLGFAVASAGDVNGDGFSDVLVGAPEFDYFAVDGGLAAVWLGGQGGPIGNDPDNLDWGGISLVGSRLGAALSSAGDANGDGHSDFLIGAPGMPNALDERVGSVWFVPGCEEASWPDCIGDGDLLIWGNQDESQFGSAVALVDANGDGFSDALVGASMYDNGQTGEGRVFLHYGNDSRGLPRIPGQMRSDFSAPIALLGKSDADDAFGLRAYGRTAAGRGEVRMEWEVKPVGIPFDGTDIQSGSTYDTGSPDPDFGSRVLLNELAVGLGTDAIYHWRLRLACDDPYFPRTPWFSPSRNAASEADLRIIDESSSTGEDESALAELWIGSHPNPFRSRTNISFGLPTSSPVSLNIYDLSGRLVRTLVSDEIDAGIYDVTWDGRGNHGRRLASGVYWLRLRTGSEDVSRQILITD